MFISGIADEAGQAIETQIKAHQELGWKHIELRQINGTCITDLNEGEFDRVAGLLNDADLTVSCFASQLANWARPIDSDFGVDEDELKRAIPRMKQLGTQWIRCMSYPNCSPPLPTEQWKDKVVDRMKRLTDVAAEGDVVLVHENCHGWASEGAQEALELLDIINSPHLKLVFDTGNPICLGQNAWELYHDLRPHVVYVHIKDYRAKGEKLGTEEDVVASFPGEGDCRVEDIVRELVNSGYNGGYSIEPHITSVIHLSQEASDPELAYNTYVEYGRKFESLLNDILASKPG